jgi:hypothetical protein
MAAEALHCCPPQAEPRVHLLVSGAARQHVFLVELNLHARREALLCGKPQWRERHAVDHVENRLDANGAVAEIMNFSQFD